MLGAIKCPGQNLRLRRKDEVWVTETPADLLGIRPVVSSPGVGLPQVILSSSHPSARLILTIHLMFNLPPALSACFCFPHASSLCDL